MILRITEYYRLQGTSGDHLLLSLIHISSSSISFFRYLSIWILSISRESDSTAHPGNLFQNLTTFGLGWGSFRSGARQSYFWASWKTDVIFLSYSTILFILFIFAYCLNVSTTYNLFFLQSQENIIWQTEKQQSLEVENGRFWNTVLMSGVELNRQ